ncbi:MAG: hypothetical protein C0392_00475 [Syntrophus sp. (in: bacteria)]|nr:hypothetical protein [Syntrophus sp. (in: bacteria)]
MMKMDFKTAGINKAIDRIATPYKIIIIAAINIIVFVVLFVLVFTPQFEEKNKLVSEYGVLKKDIDRVTLIKSNMGKYRKEYAQTQDLLQGLLKQLPEKKDIPNLLRSVSNVGTETGTKIRYFEPKALTNKEFYGELLFEIKYSGSFHNVGYFFDGVRRLERIIDISSFSLEAKGPPTKRILEGACMAKTYVYLREAPKEKKDSKSVSPVKK